MAKRTRVTFASGEHQLAGALEIPESGEPKAYVLFAHCFTCGQKSVAATRISRHLVDLGFAVLRFDFTGLGGSDGDFANTNFSSNLDDLVAAADFLRETHQAPAILVGHSLGGRAILSAAPRIPESRALVTIGAPADAEHVIRQFGANTGAIEHEGEARVSLAGREFTIQRQFLEDVKNAGSDVENLRKALLVMHSPRDEVVGIDQAEKIYRRAKHPKSFVSLDRADHLLTNRADAEYVATVIAGWSARYVSEAGVSQERPELDKGEVLVTEQNHRFTREVFTDRHQWLADEPKGVGDDLGPDPYEHLLSALGTCTSMTIRMYAERKQWPVEDIRVRLRHRREHSQDCKDPEGKPRRIEVLERELEFKGDLSQEQVNSLLSIADKCPVHRTLESDLEIRTRLNEDSTKL